jgi:hypothetical protein
MLTTAGLDFATTSTVTDSSSTLTVFSIGTAEPLGPPWVEYQYEALAPPRAPKSRLATTIKIRLLGGAGRVGGRDGR